LALAAIRKMAWSAVDGDWSAGLQSERSVQGAIGRSADAREGIAAFLEKRPAVFTGA
jgi:2-(1,2-epoxy-1,2-dihydrophenyl)acetyl-CoA isomerase